MSFPILAILLLALPALLVAFMPRRWMVPAMVLWLVSPAVLFGALTLIGKMIGTPASPQPGSATDALLLVGSFFLIPWLLTCAAGFGIGFALRRRPRSMPPPIPTGSAGPPTFPVAATAQPAPVPFPVPPTEGTSTDGALRYENRSGDPAASGAVLIEAATGRVLVDGAGWAWSRVTANDDGSLFLHLQQHQFETLLRINGGDGCFRDQVMDEAPRPLADLTEAVADALRAAAAPRPSPPTYRHISPDGMIRVDLASEEWSNSHWVNAPRVIEIATGRILLDLWGTDWDAVVFFTEIGRVRLACRRYHIGGSLQVIIDVARDRYQIMLDPRLGGALPEQPLRDIGQGMEAASRRAAADRGKGLSHVAP